LRRRCNTQLLAQEAQDALAAREMPSKQVQEQRPRKERAFIALNCGALPSNLVESSLFGFERGAFTGAERASAGAFEAAHGGTLFGVPVGRRLRTACHH
jgi:transcriptional regulator with GAF, ATPase, and Fis domain